MKAIKSFTPLHGDIFVTDIEQGMQKTAGGIILTDDNMKDTGIRARWARVHLIGPNCKADVKVGDWILIEHGRWTLKMRFDIGGEQIDMWKVDPKAIMVATDENPANQRHLL